MMTDGVSVIICCYNSAWIIERCLQALLLQKTEEDLKWEIIVVNNASVDNTKQIAESFLSKGKVAYKVVDELKSGLLNARKKGINCANYRYTIYCDDDNLLCKTYVQTAYNIINSRPELGALGGKGVAEYQATPDPFVLNYPVNYAVGSQAEHARLWVWGAGLCLRTDVVRKIYDTQTMYLTGRKENILLAGDDSELVMSIRLNGYLCDADDRLEYIHVLTAKRLTKEYFIKMHEGFALSMPIMNVYRYVLNNRTFIAIFGLYLKILLKCFLLYFYKRTDVIIFLQKCNINQLKAFHYWSFCTLYKIYHDLLTLYK